MRFFLVRLFAYTELSAGNNGEREARPELEEAEGARTETKTSKLLEKNRERRKVVSATLEDLTECVAEEEEGEEDSSIVSPPSLSPFSSSSSFRSKFSFSRYGRKVNGGGGGALT